MLTRQSPYALCGSTDISSISGWIGASGYNNYIGTGIAIVATYDQPFGITGIVSNDTIGTAVPGFGRLSGLGANAVRMARLGTVNTILAGVYCGSGSGHCLYYTGGAGISPQSDSLIRGFLTNPALGVEDKNAGEDPKNLSLRLDVWPNPLREKTTIRYSVASRGLTELRIYDILGRLVSIEQSGVLDPGTYTLNWDGKSIKGQAVSAGIYFVRLSSRDRDETRKIVKLK